MKCIKLWLTIVQIFHRKHVLFPNWTTDLCGRVYHKSNFGYIIQSFSKAYNWIKSRHRSSWKLCGNHSDTECLLFEGVTDIKYMRLSHKSQIKGRIKCGVIYPPNPQGLVMARASCNLICGISFMSFGVIQRQNPLEFMTYCRNFNLRHGMRKLVFSYVRADQTQVFHVRHFGNYFSYLVSEKQRHWSDWVSLLVMSYIIQLLSSRRCSFHYQKTATSFILDYMHKHKKSHPANPLTEHLVSG